MPNLPIFVLFFIDDTPITIDVKIKGTITIFSNRIKISPHNTIKVYKIELSSFLLKYKLLL